MPIWSTRWMSMVCVIAPSLPMAAARLCNQSDSRFPQDLADSFAVRFGDATPAWTPPHCMAAQFATRLAFLLALPICGIAAARPFRLLLCGLPRMTEEPSRASNHGRETPGLEPGSDRGVRRG